MIRRARLSLHSSGSAHAVLASFFFGTASAARMIPVAVPSFVAHCKVLSCVFGALFFAMTPSCTVLEDRSDCPCRVVLDFSSSVGSSPVGSTPVGSTPVDSTPVGSTPVGAISSADASSVGTSIADTVSSPGILFPVRVYAVSGGRLLCYREVEDLSEPVVLDLPRRGVDLFAVSGVSADSVLPEGSHGGFGGVAIPTGEECPPLYWWRTSLETREETVCLEPRLRKQFCRLTMTLPTTLDAHVIDKEQLTFTFEGSVCGYDAEMNPASGPFSFTPEVQWFPSDIIASPLGGEGSFFLRRTVSVRLPRQTDASLMLHVTRNGSLIRSFSVGSYIAASGFDWSAPDLPDLSLSLDFATWTLRLTPSASLTDVNHDLSI